MSFTIKKNVIISWSSGKDSTLTLERLLEDKCYNVIGLHTTYVNEEVPFQATPLYVIDLLTEPVIKIKLPAVAVGYMFCAWLTAINPHSSRRGESLLSSKIPGKNIAN